MPEGSQPTGEPVGSLGATLDRITAKLRAKPRAEPAKPTPDRVPAHIETLWSSAGFPMRHRQRERLDLAGWPPEAADRIQASEASLFSGESLLLVGPRGRGKTQLATQLARRWFEVRQRGVRYTRVFDMLNQIKRSAYDENKPRPDFEFTSVGLLVIDELHEQRMSEDDALWFGTVFDKRYADMRPTILVSNLMPDGVAELVGKSVWSRMQESARVVVCDWESFRKRGGA